MSVQATRCAFTQENVFSKHVSGFLLPFLQWPSNPETIRREVCGREGLLSVMIFCEIIVYCESLGGGRLLHEKGGFRFYLGNVNCGSEAQECL